jgi:gamma-glutamyl-gamma-aminobutyrate hydrolase PuuD
MPIKVLQQHHDLLQAHRRFIEALKAHSKGVEGAGEVFEVCASQVDSMVEDFEQCKSKFVCGPYCLAHKMY